MHNFGSALFRLASSIKHPVNTTPLRIALTIAWVGLMLAASQSHSFESLISETPPASLAPSIEKQAKIKAASDEAEVLYAINTSRVMSDGHWEQQNYYSIRIHSLEAARDYGRLTIPFNHYYSAMQIDFARVRSASGKVSHLAEDAVQLRVTGGGQDFYSDSSELVFSLPDVSPGSIIEFQYSQKSNELAFPELYTERGMPYWFQRKVGHDGWRGDYVHNYSLSLTSPKSLPIYTKAFKGFPEKPSKKSSGETLTRKWTLSKVPTFFPENWSPELHRMAPLLRISTLKDWAKVDAWTWNNAKDKIQPTPELKTIIANLNLPEQATRDEKIRAVYGYLQNNIRYVFAHLGRGGYEPHFANEVVNANYGDCKDQTIVGVALLRMLGVNAYPALVETASEGRSDTQLVALIFNHMLIYIPADDHHPAIWMDTTGDRSLYPGMSNYSKGQTALIVNGEGGKLTKIEGGFSENIAHVFVDYKQPKNNTMDVEIRIELSGFFEQNIRSWWTHNNNKETGIKSFLSSMFSNALDYTVTGEVLNSDHLWKHTVIKGTLHFKDSEDNFETLAASFGQANNLFGNFSSMQVPETRKTPYEDLTEWKLYYTATFRGADDTQHTLLGASDDMHTPYFTLTQKGKQEGNDYTVHMEYTKPKHTLTADQYRDYYEQLNKLNQIGAWTVSQTQSEQDPALAKLEAIKVKNGEKSFKYQIALARHSIETGNFEAALPPAEKAVALNNTSGEAWHVLGTAQGFNSLIEDSIASFEKAESLGYTP